MFKQSQLWLKHVNNRTYDTGTSATTTNNNSSGHFCSAVSYRQGKPTELYTMNRMYVRKISKVRYKHNTVIFAAHTHTHARTHAIAIPLAAHPKQRIKRGVGEGSTWTVHAEAAETTSTRACRHRFATVQHAPSRTINGHERSQEHFTPCQQVRAIKPISLSCEVRSIGPFPPSPSESTTNKNSKT